MKYIILFMLLIHFSDADTLTLKHVLKAANDNNRLIKAKDYESLFLEAKNQADTAMDPLELYGTGTRAYPKFDASGNEYSVGLSKQLPLGDSKKEEQMINRLNNEAYLLEEEKKILNFENGLKSLYHQHCLDHKNYKSFRQNFEEFVKLYKKKQKAYQYQEISKTELMQLEIEKNRLYAQLEELKASQMISKQKLFILGNIRDIDKNVLVCNDMYPIRENVELKENAFTLSQEAYEKRIKSTQVALKRHSRALDSIELSAQYDQEIDIDRYTVGVSVPLTFTSKRSEQERVAALHKNSALSFQYEQDMLEKRSIFMELKRTLKSKALMIRSLQSNLDNYNKQLLPLIKKGYELGESSVIEYLLNRQNYYQINQELLALQKNYYQTLFTLYTISEMKDNK
ncbi:MAG TPA: TolC family protein [Sulfurovum sp.]